MVALLHDHSVRTSPSRPVRSARRRRAPRRHLAVVAAPAPAGAAVPTWVVLAVAAVVLGITMSGLRLAQGAPPSSWAELRSGSVAAGSGSVQPGDAVITVQAGDTLWAIAQRLAPGRDPRPVLDVLTRANGGSQVQAGQQVVIPASLAG